MLGMKAPSTRPLTALWYASSLAAIPRFSLLGRSQTNDKPPCHGGVVATEIGLAHTLVNDDLPSIVLIEPLRVPAPVVGRYRVRDQIFVDPHDGIARCHDKFAGAEPEVTDLDGV